jgi:hypothetical protein
LQAVELDMLEHHKKRDKAHRTFLTNKWCEFFGTNQVAVGKYIKSDRGRVKRQRADRKRQLAARK